MQEKDDTGNTTHTFNFSWKWPIERGEPNYGVLGMIYFIVKLFLILFAAMVIWRVFDFVVLDTLTMMWDMAKEGAENVVG